MSIPLSRNEAWSLSETSMVAVRCNLDVCLLVPWVVTSHMLLADDVKLLDIFHFDIVVGLGRRCQLISLRSPRENKRWTERAEVPFRLGISDYFVFLVI